jgi:hypothetical protein
MPNPFIKDQSITQSIAIAIFEGIFMDVSDAMNSYPDLTSEDAEIVASKYKAMDADFATYMKQIT